MATRELTCINCPLGCNLTVEVDDDNKVLKVTGNRCGRGISYAKSEIQDPRRIVCSSVDLENGRYPVVSVKTAEPIPKNKIFDVMEEVNKVHAKAPVHIGDVLVPNVAGTGTDLVVTREAEEN